MRLEIRAIGRLRGPEAELCAEYLKRLGKHAVVKEHDVSKGLTGVALQRKEAAGLLADLPELPVVVLDERGVDEDSAALARRLANWQERGGAVFLLGGADGHDTTVRDRADHVMSLGRKTWPHALARVMLLEQIYRARQILAGHPYHRV